MSWKKIHNVWKERLEKKNRTQRNWLGVSPSRGSSSGFCWWGPWRRNVRSISLCSVFPVFPSKHSKSNATQGVCCDIQAILERVPFWNPRVLPDSESLRRAWHVQPGAVKLVLWRHWMHLGYMVTSENQLHCTSLYVDMFCSSLCPKMLRLGGFHFRPWFSGLAYSPVQPRVKSISPCPPALS